MPRLKHKHITRIFLLSTLTVVALWAAWNQLHSHATQHLHHEPPNFDTEPTNASTLSALDEPTNFTRPTFHPDLLPFWSNLSAVLEDTKPSVPLPSKPIEALINGFASLGSSFNFRQDLVELSQKDVDILQNDHSRFVAQLPALAPQLPYENGTRGIVTAAAGSFVPVLVTSLRMLRKTGSKLPVEVFMESEAVYEKEICEEVLRELGAKCFVMSEVLDQVESQMVISKYQMKAFAVLFSSFDEVLLLDADEIAVVAPEELLDGVVFGEKGFVSWPDYWANTASPKYYQISSQQTPSTSTRASSESGQLLFSKSKHASTLLLTLYYNAYGPSHYYTLLSQGAVGQGDKETYLAAAMALKAPFYTVATNIETLGHEGKDGAFQGCGSVQHNPDDDYQIHELHNKTLKAPRRAFVHAQHYKMNAAELPPRFHQEAQARLWGSREGMMEKFGRDLEMQLWADTLYTGCQLEHSFKAWENMTHVCQGISDVYKFLFP